MAQQADGEYPTIIGPDAIFKGELSFEKGVRILGKFEGKIATKGELHVAEGARVSADIEAGIIQVEGQVKGNLTASGKVQLKSSAKLEGDLRTARLEVVDGAVFVGNCVVGQQAVPKEPQPAGARSQPVPSKKAPEPQPQPQPVTK